MREALDRGRRRRLGGAAGLCIGLFAAACGSEGTVVRRFAAARLVGSPGAPRLVSSAERFGMHGPAPASLPSASQPRLEWETPPGWRELAGDGGGLLANVDRWREQMSLPPVTAEEAAAFERAELFGGEALLVDLEGSFQGEPGYRLVGLLRIDAAGSKFLKMIGPSEVVGAERDAFHALARSFRETRAPRAQPRPDDARKASIEASLAESNGSASGLFWSAPASWRRGPDRAFRAVTFQLPGEGGGECYVTVLAGDGGGLGANVDRWRGQMGQPPLDGPALAALERIEMLGSEAVVVEILGAYEGRSEAGMLLGAVCGLSGQSVFVKMIGPRRVVEQERAAFLAFCGSLEREGR